MEFLAGYGFVGCVGSLEGYGVVGCIGSFEGPSWCKLDDCKLTGGAGSDGDTPLCASLGTERWVELLLLEMKDTAKAQIRLTVKIA